MQNRAAFCLVRFLPQKQCRMLTRHIPRQRDMGYAIIQTLSIHQRWSRGHKARGQGQGHKKISRPRPRPRTDSLEAKAKDQGHRRKCSPKKKVFKNFFQAKKVFKIFFSGDLYLRKPKKRSLQIFCKVYGVFRRNFNGSKIVVSSSRGQGSF